ncbi:Rho termination factor N-terminal domain-containing protein [Romboutsia sp. 1001216sp1]|nr:Rho termination factor N-terminal domain-containing protein [Romboutsia sp. 1001216sp1]MDB8805020.1 Rho termination factor N-terminal domain-containing protein [Romboutsia sp. 1001216sp1]MDB8808010.1 Rho termination factor N-terminal domain-containing protein [Romboutsia sp. 1001216sp1]MDB8810665.1 Rho termination factor N-terminal domain-containing protein [Romboutsia sp. 1001216sp1]MDB8816385.1 Rho termination factor N-terminal domain-containing protein [Romboutsia sp. 1001216sp1]MDB88186
MDLENLNVKELKSLAKEKGIEGYSDMKKSELIQILK